MASADDSVSNGKIKLEDSPSPPPKPVIEPDRKSSGRRRSSNLLELGRQSGRREDGKIELTEQDAWEVTGFAFPIWKKWLVLSVIFAVQSSMNVRRSQVHKSRAWLLA